MGDANVKGLLSGVHSGAWLGHCWQRLLHFLYGLGQCCCQWKVRNGGERTGILCLLSSTSLERSVTLNDQTGSLSTASALPTWPWLWRHKHTGGGHNKRHLKYNFQCSRGHTPIIFSVSFTCTNEAVLKLRDKRTHSPDQQQNGIPGNVESGQRHRFWIRGITAQDTRQKCISKQTEIWSVHML